MVSWGTVETDCFGLVFYVLSALGLQALCAGWRVVCLKDRKRNETTCQNAQFYQHMTSLLLCVLGVPQLIFCAGTCLDLPLFWFALAVSVAHAYFHLRGGGCEPSKGFVDAGGL